MRLVPLCALLFLSGGAALALEVAWFRRLAQIAGATSVALAAVLAAVIGGMALGAGWLGPRADRVRRPLRLYAGLEAVTAALALLSPWTLDLAEPLFVALARHLAGAPALLAAARFLLALVVLAPASVCMGATLPAMAAAWHRRGRTLGRGLGALYAANTLGGVAGVLLAGFVLLPALGLSSTMRAAACASAVAAAIAFALRAPPTSASPEPADPGWTPTDAQRREAVLLYALSGFLGMASEASFVRGLVLVVGSATYAFSLMLATFLAGIGIGGALGAAWLRREDRAPARLRAAVVATAMGLSLGAYAIWLLPRWFLEGYLALGASFEAGVWLRALLVAAVMLPGAIGLGVAFPLAAHVAAKGRVGRGTGRVYAANTLGSVLGSTTAVFVLVPLLGPVAAVGLAAVVVALAVVIATRRWRLAPLAVLAAAALVPPDARARERLLSGIYTQPRAYLAGGAIWEHGWADGRDVPFFRYGREATVSLERWYGRYGFRVNGKTEATNQSASEEGHLALLGHLPMALHPDPQRVLVVGLGMGVSYRAVAAHAPRDVVVVELEPAVADAAAYVGVRPTRLVFEDGRTFVRATDERFDVITSDPIHPWVRGAGDLYSAEYFEACRGALAPGGVVSHWLPLYQLSLDDVRSIVRTFASVFRTSVWFSGTNLALVGTVEGAPPSARAARGSARAALEELGVTRVGDLFVFGHDEAVAAAGPGRILRDDDLHLEFSTPREVENPSMGAVLRWVLEHWRSPAEPFGSLLEAMRASAEGDAKGFEAAFSKARAGGPNNAFVRRFQGERYLTHAASRVGWGVPDEVERYLGFAKALLPGDPRLLGVEAEHRETEGDLPRARALLEQLLAASPDSDYLRRRLARLRAAEPPGR